MRTLPLLAATLLLTACSQSHPTTHPTPAPQPASPLAGPYWHLTSLPNNTPLPPGPPPFVQFAPNSNRLTGHTGVNSMGGGYSVEGASVKLSNLFSTRMAAADPARNALEQTFIAALSDKTLPYSVNQNTLRLGDLTFAAHDTRPTR